MKTIIPLMCLALALVSCDEKLSRRDMAEIYFARIGEAELADYQVGKLRLELEDKPDAGTAQLLAVDLRDATEKARASKAEYLQSYREWLEVADGQPDFQGPLESYKTAIIKARVAAVRGDEAEFERLRGMEFVAVMGEFRGK